VVPAAAGGVARTTSPAERKDAWGKPLDASGKVVALPAKPTGDVPACCGHVHQGACATTCPICSGKQS
jgi:hypothetical protein